MSNEHITNYLDYYLNRENNFPNYAVLIRGNWGCGKTWFVKKYIEKNHEKRFIYLSLYGINDIKDIESVFFEQLHPFLSSKSMRVAGKLLKGFVKTSIKIDFDDLENIDSSITNASSMKLPILFKGLENVILVFDDLERCSMKTELVLGYINQFIEHFDQRVLIIANEEEIISNDSETKYLKIKEKLIGKSFDYLSNVETALDFFISQTQNKEKDILNNHRSLIVDLYIQAKYNNLRHLKQAVIDFGRFISFLPDKVLDNKDLINHLVSFFMIISFELKKGTITEVNLNDILSSSFDSRVKSDD